MGVSKNSGTPKWMVKIMENPIKMDDLGVPLFSATSIRVFIMYIYHVFEMPLNGGTPKTPQNDHL